MCVICIKPKGVEMPSDIWIENMWYSNPDGAGFMWADKGKVHIRKGYMDLEDFTDALNIIGPKEKLKDYPIVMHFRIGTAGGNVPANTHPFPISDSIPVLQKLSCNANVGVVHNGIIPIKPRQQNISDTMEYIAATLAPLYRYDNEFYRSKDLLQMIGNQTGSKLAFMNGKGQIFTVGSFTEDSGLLFSNTSYLSSYYYRRTPTRFYGIYGTDYDNQYDEWFAGSGVEITQDLMMLDDDCYLVDLDNGDFVGCDEYLIFMDSVGFLYIYDDHNQCCYPLADNYAAYNSLGHSVRFDAEKAAPMLIDETEEIVIPTKTMMLDDGNDDKKEKNDKPDPDKDEDVPF